MISFFRNSNLLNIRYHSSNYINQLKTKIALLQKTQSSVPSATLVVQQKNHCVYLKDDSGKFKYLSEVKTDKGIKGVVLDIRDKFIGVALYNSSPKTISISPSDTISKYFAPQTVIFKQIVDINNKIIFSDSNENQIIQLDNQRKKTFHFYKLYRDVKIPVLNPIFKICHNFIYGDFIIFEGTYGSGKTHAAIQLIQSHAKIGQKTAAIYVNLNINDCLRLKNINCNWIAFTENDKEISDAGGLFLGLKAVDLARRLRDTGYNVLVVIQNLNQFLRRQVSLLKNFNQEIAPFSIINQLYSQSGVNSKYKTTITTVVTLQQQSQGRADIISQTSTPFGNSLNHVHSLGVPIKFPLSLQISNETNFISQCVNRMIREKSQLQLKKQMKLENEPWDYFFLHDSDWWSQSLKCFKPKDQKQLNLFLQFLQWNISNEYPSQWNKPAHEVFTDLLLWLNQFTTEKTKDNQTLFSNFLLHAKIEGLFNPFKKDYLP